MLLPLFPLHSEVHDPPNTTSCELPHASMEAEFPTEKWVHFGCEVCKSTDQNMVGSSLLKVILEGVYKIGSLFGSIFF